MEVRVCASKQVTVILEPCSLGYDYIHGHDLIIEACYCGKLGEYIDVEKVMLMLESAIKGNVIPIDSLTGKRCSLIEDLLVYIAGTLNKSLGSYVLCAVEAKWNWGSRKITLTF